MKCVCEERGVVRSGIRGILAGPPNNYGCRIMEKCDACDRFPSDESAGLWYASAKGGASRYDKQARVIWCPK
jgi:hypothetical protein